MKTTHALVASLFAAILMGAATGRATIYSYDFNSGFVGGTTIADASPTGWADSRAIDTGDANLIRGLTVRLDLSGGYNGDLYGYLVLTDPSSHSTLAFSTLLNRVGTGSGSEPQLSFGYGDSGLNIALKDGAANGSIHTYQTLGGGYATAIANGGAFATDGGSLAAFNDNTANYTWTLFLADMSGGSVTSVTSWGLDIDVVPEPTTWAIMIFAGLLIGGQGVGWLRRKIA